MRLPFDEEIDDDDGDVGTVPLAPAAVEVFPLRSPVSFNPFGFFAAGNGGSASENDGVGAGVIPGCACGCVCVFAFDWDRFNGVSCVRAVRSCDSDDVDVPSVCIPATTEAAVAATGALPTDNPATAPADVRRPAALAAPPAATTAAVVEPEAEWTLEARGTAGTPVDEAPGYPAAVETERKMPLGFGTRLVADDLEESSYVGGGKTGWTEDRPVPDGPPPPVLRLADPAKSFCCLARTSRPLVTYPACISCLVKVSSASPMLCR